MGRAAGTSSFAHAGPSLRGVPAAKIVPAPTDRPASAQLCGWREMLVRTVLAAAAAVLLLSSPVFAQGTPPAAGMPAPGTPAPAMPAPGAPAPGAPGSAEQSLKTDPNVQRSQDPQPSAQGTRAPNPTNTPTATTELQQLLWQTWNAPVDIQGNLIPRPGK